MYPSVVTAPIVSNLLIIPNICFRTHISIHLHLQNTTTPYPTRSGRQPNRDRIACRPFSSTSQMCRQITRRSRAHMHHLYFPLPDFSPLMKTPGTISTSTRQWNQPRWSMPQQQPAGLKQILKLPVFLVCPILLSTTRWLRWLKMKTTTVTRPPIRSLLTYHRLQRR